MPGVTLHGVVSPDQGSFEVAREKVSTCAPPLVEALDGPGAPLLPSEAGRITSERYSPRSGLITSSRVFRGRARESEHLRAPLVEALDGQGPLPNVAVIYQYYTGVPHS